MALLNPSEPESESARQAPKRSVLWSVGFRPFYLLAGLFATLSVTIWAARFSGWLGDWVYGSDPLWHAHEMIFGYALAVIVGFLFTAGRNWTGQPTPTGASLAAIAGLWLAARVLVFTPWPLAAAAADTAFALAAAAGLAVPLWRSGNHRNYFLVALLLALGTANLAFYLAKEEILDMPVSEGLQIALDLILFIMTVMAGRVIPMFTMNAVPGAKGTRLGWLERLALGSVLLLIAADLYDAPEKIIAVIAGLAALAHAARLALWQPWLTLRRPILWILHAAYAWVPIHLALRALAALGVLPENLATHALTVGVIGSLTLGMMTRTARGHTGRSLQAGLAETACYALVQLAAVARVFVPIAAPQFYSYSVTLSGVFWVIAFALFTVTYWPILTRPRADGRPD